MDKMKRFIECYIPTETCNLRCHYCYITQQRKFNNKLAEFKYSPEYIRKALSVNRLGGVCLFNLCAGGETLLSDQVIKIIEALLEEGHYVMVVTNGTLTNRFKEISRFKKELLSRLFFKFSFHYLELLKRNTLDVFFENVSMMRKCGCSFSLEITPSDEAIPYIDEIKKICIEKAGAICHTTIARDDRTGGKNILSKYSFEEYEKIWGSFDSDLFNVKCNIYGKKVNKFCYAGDWSIYVDLVSGDVRQCYGFSPIDNIYTDLAKPIKFMPIGYGCTQPYCYNGHAFLTFGDVPELKTITFDRVRNRKDKNGMEWLGNNMKNFMSQKLKDNNIQYTYDEKKEFVKEQFKQEFNSVGILDDIINNKKKIAIFTTGGGGKKVYSFLSQLGVNVECFLDNNSELNGKFLYDKPIMMVNDFVRKYGVDECSVFIATLSHSDDIVRQLQSYDVNSIILNEKLLNGIIKCEDYRKIDTELEKLRKKKKILFCHIPEHGNLGDQAIAYATEKFLDENFKDYNIIKVYRDNIYMYYYKLQQIINEDDLIFINGGGNMGNLWPEEEKVRIFILDKFKGHKIVSMPTTITYTNDENGMIFNDLSKEFYDKCGKNLILIAREEKSYETMEENFKQNNILKYPDIVLYLSKFDFNNQDERTNVRVIFRQDKESMLSSHKKQIIDDIKEKYTIEYDDTVLSKSVSNETREEELVRIFDRFKRSKIIVTDRMHAMIFAYLTKTPCIVFKSLDNKIPGSYEWIKDVEYIKMINLEDCGRILKYIDELNGIKIKKYIDFNEKYFKQMAYDIMKLLK